MSPALTVLYEDRHFLVVAKPARQLTASDDTGDDTLLESVRRYHTARQAPGKKGFVAPVHFLDRPVSGVVLFALSSKGASRLAEQFRERKITKVYRAIVEGLPSKTEDLLEDYLVKDRGSNITSVGYEGQDGAKLSRLSYRILASHGGRTMLEVRPVTGRSHQIRVQLASRGWPIVGDRKYGAKSGWDGMIALHALWVRLSHPITKEDLTVLAPLPDCWQTQWSGPVDV